MKKNKLAENEKVMMPLSEYFAFFLTRVREATKETVELNAKKKKVLKTGNISYE